jgi:hypothetical protein
MHEMVFRCAECVLAPFLRISALVVFWNFLSNLPFFVATPVSCERQFFDTRFRWSLSQEQRNKTRLIGYAENGVSLR